MDITKEYIRMCEDAKEIQRDWQPKTYDLFWDTFGGTIENGWEFIVGKPDDYSEPFGKEESYIFLPRQDQLQGMIDWRYKLESHIHFYNIEWDSVIKEDRLLNAIFQRNTMEKILLEMIMKVKFNKVWIKDKWVTKQ